MAKHTFIINDENELNSYGFRVLTSAVSLKQYKKNPLVLWMHRRPSRWGENDKNTDRFPIGKATNVRKNPENAAQILADVEFDMSDDFAAKVAGKVEAGLIRMCSMGLNVKAWSDKKEHLIMGQTRSTVTKCELVEISIVDIGSNPSAVKLYDDELADVTLSAEGECAIPLIQNENNTELTDKGYGSSENPNKKNMEDLRSVMLAAFGMDEKATDADIIKVALSLKSENDSQKEQIVTLTTERDDLKSKIEGNEKDVVLSAAVDQKLITGEQRKVYEKLSVEDIKAALPTKAAVNLANVPGGEGGPSEGAWEKRQAEIN